MDTVNKKKFKVVYGYKNKEVEPEENRTTYYVTLEEAQKAMEAIINASNDPAYYVNLIADETDN